MGNIIKHYNREDLTVVWKPDLCIHSTKCWRDLGHVFNPQQRPWVNMDGAALSEIKHQVDCCPSGALSYLENNLLADAETNDTENGTTIEVMKSGPLLVYGNVTVKDINGKEIRKSRVTAFCRCGASANKPFCDGMHKETGFKDSQE